MALPSKLIQIDGPLTIQQIESFTWLVKKKTKYLLAV